MERELFNNMLGSSLYVYMFQLQPFEGGRDADVAHGEHEFDALVWINTLHVTLKHLLLYC